MEVVLDELATVEGQFVDLMTGEGIPDIDLQCSISGKGVYSTAFTKSNENGRFRLVNLFPDARIYLIASGAGTKFQNQCESDWFGCRQNKRRRENRRA